MNQRPCVPGLALMLLAFGTLVEAQEQLPSQENYTLRADYREYRSKPTGKAQKGPGGEQAGTLLDLEEDLGVLDKRTFEVRATLQLKPGRKLRGAFMPLDYDGDVAANRVYRFGKARFERFSQVVTSIKGNYYAAAYEWDFVRGSRGFLGATLGARLFDVDYVIVSPNESEREQDTLRVPIPVLGLASRLYAGRLSLEGELAGLTAGGRGSLWELELVARLHISDHLAAQGGYRSVSLRGEDKPDQVEFRLGGWQFGLELSL